MTNLASRSPPSYAENTDTSYAGGAGVVKRMIGTCAKGVVRATTAEQRHRAQMLELPPPSRFGPARDRIVDSGPAAWASTGSNRHRSVHTRAHVWRVVMAAIRGTLCAAVFLMLMVQTWPARAAPRTVEIGQIVPRSGPLANVGNEVAGITQATFEDFNRRQGELLLRLNSLDDGNDGDRSANLATELPTGTVALLSCFGTVGCLAQQRVANQRGLPLVGPIAGAGPLRGPRAGMSFAVRASAGDELRRLLGFAQTTGLNRIAVLVQDDGFGRAYAVELEREARAFRDLSLELHRFDPGAASVDKLVTHMQSRPAKALLLLANAAHSTAFLNAWRTRSTLPFVLNLAAQANALYATRLKGYTGAAAFVTVTPSPWAQRTALQRDYQRVARQAGLAISYLGFETYLNARLLIDSLQRSGSRSGPELARFLDKLQSHDIGGFVVDYAQQRRGGTFTDLSLLRRDGSYVH